MPLIQKTVYIREEDIEAWSKVPNKAEFIHNALDGNLGVPTSRRNKIENMKVNKDGTLSKKNSSKPVIVEHQTFFKKGKK